MNINKSSLLIYLLALTGFFLLLEISLFIQSSDVYLGDFRLIADHLTIPPKVIPAIIYFITVQLFLHFLYTVIIWGLTLLVGIGLNFSETKTEKAGFYLWFLGIIFLLLANQYCYPNSKFAHLVSILINPVFGKMLLIMIFSLFLIILCLAIKGSYSLFPKKTIFILLGSALIIPIGLAGQAFKKETITSAGTAEKPNIILIGIDALRPDFLGFFGYEKQTPYIDNFLNHSIVFTDALTPIGRTFPAWISILTGQYPKNNGVRFNLPNLKTFNWEHTLPHILRLQGYETIFATDETRFSNIDQRFGFDKTIMPLVGFNDFLLGNLNDFPMSNLLINTVLGDYLFPYSSGNRPVSVTYDPNQFLRLLKPELKQSRSRPLFLAIHFCLPHYPYIWGKQAADDKSIHNYQAAVSRVDQQFYDFMSLLKQSKLLEKSIVVLLSDHGEAIELPGDRITEKDLFIPGENNQRGIIPHFYPKSFDFETVNQSAGHGTDILGLTQYHVVLAFRGYGLDRFKDSQVITGPVSLLDIKPTILDYLKISENHVDGQVILNRISFPTKHFFMETDFSPQAIRSVHPETRQLLFAGIEYYQIDPATTRIMVKNNMENLIISSKQLADVYGEWILALYPQNNSVMTPILVNLNSGLWTNDLHSTFAKASPAMQMLAALKKFYGKEITSVENIPA